MNRDGVSCRALLLAILGVYLFLPSEKSSGYPAWTNGWHLDCPLQAGSNADLVCKIQVLSTRRAEIIKGYLPGGQADPSRMLAKSKVLSVIKGECKPAIDIEFHDPKARPLRSGFPPGGRGTELTKGEVCIVFLKRQEGRYILNRIRSKLRVQPKVVDYNLGETPNLKLLAEMLAGCDSKNEMVQLQAVEELGYIGEEMIEELSPFEGDKELFERIAFGLVRAKEALRNTRRCEDPVIRNMSIISSFQVDDSPGIEGSLELLRMNPSDFDKYDSLKKYGTWGFCVSDLQLRLLETMDHTTRRFLVNLKDRSRVRRKDNGGPYRGVRGFDYVEFYRQALDCEVVKKNERMRSAIANVIWIRYEKRSVPEMIRLLDDSSRHIRSTAVSALRKCINSDMSNSWERRHFYDANAAREYMRRGVEKKLEDRQKDYRDNEREYILYWKQWWQKHRIELETLEETNSGID